MKNSSNLYFIYQYIKNGFKFQTFMEKADKYILVLKETDSTNNYANRLISSGGAEGGTVVLSHYQHKGRGQLGNHWESARELNLLASIILFPAFLPPGKQFYLSKIASLALADWLRQKTDNVSIKWPNDIYVKNRKIAGILIETTIQGNLFHSAVLGFGLNLNQVEFSPELPNPVSLKQLTGINYNLIDTASQIRKIFMKWYQRLETGHIGEIDDAYLENLFRINEWALFKEEGQLLEARIKGTSEFGQLVLEDRSGNLRNFSFKEVEFII
ncbi:biotin--[acetyl-CoA-carboxylase] ligase [Mariniphaga sediminis]|uniref:Biotin--[acetyl-CoA-carboxylase] ligase n=2 Tax=Mariniphaga sediminis TaxID=1628158 RepID=A0A399D8U2_9BACT|nr:biotin--[acetyl-CoA-carboxylase] ligase [Mariniphaga sediminis]